VQNNNKLFNKNSSPRAKSFREDSKEVKMDFLNLNEFISTLGRGFYLNKMA